MTLQAPPPDWIADEDAGQDFVLIHGMVMAPSFWQTYAPDIARHGRTAAYPLPGHHPWKLCAPARTIDPREVADAYAEAIQRDFGGRPVHLIGHSTGGFVALLFALHHPHLVRSIILIGAFACGRFEGQERLPARLLRVPRVGAFLFGQFFRRWISTPAQFRWGSIECVYDKLCPWQDDRAVAAMEKVRLELLQARPEDIAACIRFMSATTLVGELTQIKAPVLNLVGANDAIVPPAHQLRVSKHLPQAQTVILANCGHLPMVEHQARTDQVISAFVYCLSMAAASTATVKRTWRAASALAGLHRLVGGLSRPVEQSFDRRVQSAHDRNFHPGLGEGPHEYHSHRHSYSAADRRLADLGS
jgi:pimeloyl-ACP methyl ester carboxylesterase